MGHLTNEQRYTISCMKRKNYTQKSIAEAIGKDKSVVSRELKRNSDKRNGVYKYELAISKTKKRKKEKARHIKFTPTLQKVIEDLIREDYSPEQVVGLLKKKAKESVSIERIYQHIWADKKKGGTLYTHLRNQGRRYRKRGGHKDSRGIIKDRVSIEKRPLIVEERSRFGDLEVDLIIGENHKQAIVTVNDRASGVLKMKKVVSKEAKVVSQAINELLEEWSPFLYTITSDNGKEFAEHKLVASQQGIDYYFAHPYHSWERGSNENLNGLVRQYIKKGSSFLNLTDDYIKSIETKINNRPRKRFNYETPIFVMNKLLFNDKVALVS